MNPPSLKQFQQQLSKRAQRIGIILVPEQVENLDRYYQLLVRWNAKVNLTGFPLSPPGDEAVDRLFIEPLAALPYVPSGSISWLDIGSGSGSPAIPIKLERASTRLTMVESRGRKAAFLREVVRALALPDAAVDNRRFEMVAVDPGIMGAMDLVTVRAVALTELFPHIVRILTPGGRALIFCGRRRSEVSDSGLRLVETVDLAGDGSSGLEIFERTDERHG